MTISYSKPFVLLVFCWLLLAASTGSANADNTAIDQNGKKHTVPGVEKYVSADTVKSSQPKHIKIEILSKAPAHLRKCRSDKDCARVFGSIKGACVRCPQVTMAYGKQAFPAPLDYGFCEQAHMAGDFGAYYFENNLRVLYCIVAYRGFDIPTNKSEFQRYLPVWEEWVLKSQDISETYFHKHVFVKSFESRDWAAGTSIIINYSVNIGWVSFSSCDNLLVKKKGAAGYMSKEEIFDERERVANLQRGTYLGSCGPLFKLREIKQVIESELVGPLLKKCHKSVKPAGASLDMKGQLIMMGNGTINFDQNLCKHAKVDLEAGSLLECADSACWIQ